MAIVARETDADPRGRCRSGPSTSTRPRWRRRAGPLLVLGAARDAARGPAQMVPARRPRHGSRPDGPRRREIRGGQSGERGSGALAAGRLRRVFCRNVLMYFAPEQMRAAIARIAQSLAPGGFLFLGHAETLRGISDAFICATPTAPSTTSARTASAAPRRCPNGRCQKHRPPRPRRSRPSGMPGSTPSPGRPSGWLPSSPRRPATEPAACAPGHGVVAIGASTGGPGAIVEILRALSRAYACRCCSSCTSTSRSARRSPIGSTGRRRTACVMPGTGEAIAAAAGRDRAWRLRIGT